VNDTIECKKDKNDYPVLNMEVLDDNCENYRPNIDELIKINHGIEKNDMYIIVYEWVMKHMTEKKNIIVSLSGGVDSMVLIWLLYQMKLRDIINNVFAVHIDYGNREVSKQEAAIVEQWAGFLNIEIFTRRLHFIKRDGTIERSVYEEVTRRCRFATYKC